MKRQIVFALLLLAVIIIPACSVDDPWPEDFYSRNIYPAGPTYDIGSASLPYESIYADNITVSEMYADNTTAIEIYADSVILGEAPLLIPAYGEIYNTEFLNVECETAGQYYLIAGNTTTGELLGFEDNGLGRLTYTDVTNDRICMVTTAMAISLAPADRPAIISAKLYKNGISDNASYIGEYISDDDPADALPIMCLIELDPGDYIEIYTASNTANVTVIVNTMTMVATTVD